MSTREQTALELKLTEVEAQAIATMNEHVPAGLAIGIVHRGRVLYARGFGLAQIEQE
jgi:CubicO group peptidase (beta-lactamase class C family)